MLKNFLKSSEDEILLSAILKKSREFLIAHPEFKISASQSKKFLEMQKLLQKGYPLAYLLKEKWFFGRKFYVNKNVLIPRPETELLVENALSYLKEKPVSKLIDIGTGSGAIIITTKLEAAKINAKTSQKIRNTKYFAVDISKPALAVAKKNARNLKAAKITFLRGSLLEPLKNQLLQSENNLILANLPYLSQKELSEKTIRYEPRLALYGGKDDFNKIRLLLFQAKKLKLSDSAIFLEINYNQFKQTKNLAKKLWPDSKVETLKDYSGFYRLVKIFLP